MKYLFIILTLLFIVSCGEDPASISVTSDQPNGVLSVPGDGHSTIELTFTLKSPMGDIPDDTKVKIVTDNGTLVDGKKLKVELPSKNEKVVVKLFAPSQKGSANVDASFTDIYTGKAVTKRVVITFSDLAVGSKLSACNFKVTCLNKNISAFTDSTIKVECNVQTQDREGGDVVVPELKFFVEAGKMEKIKDKWYYVVEPGELPKDVKPLTDGDVNINEIDCKTFGEAGSKLREPCRNDNIGNIKNPRDGVVTIVAYANGEECFFDQNSNGEFDVASEVYEGLGEPYVDSNDNGTFDSDEKYIDTNSNGQRDPDEGMWNDDTMIFTSTRILLTGGIYEDREATRFEANGNYIDSSAAGEGAPLQCGSGNEILYKLYLMDENLNPIAGSDTESELKIDVKGWKVEPKTVSRSLKDDMGMKFIETIVAGRKSLTVDFNDRSAVEEVFKVKSLATSKECTDRTSVTQYEIKASLKTKTAIKNDEYSPQDIEEEWNIKGTIE